MTSEGGTMLDEEVSSEVAAALPPGRYVVAFTLDGYQPESREVVIIPGKTAELTVTMRAR